MVQPASRKLTLRTGFAQAYQVAVKTDAPMGNYLLNFCVTTLRDPYFEAGHCMREYEFFA